VHLLQLLPAVQAQKIYQQHTQGQVGPVCARHLSDILIRFSRWNVTKIWYEGVNSRRSFGVYNLADPTDNTTGSIRNLGETIRKVRTAETERSDVVVELRDAERGRLEILAEELRNVFDEVPPDDEQFIFTVGAGIPPRLWIDMTSFVVMGRDRRTYRFLKDTRLGRAIILETPDLSDVADTITHYVAERIIERERAIEGEWLLKQFKRDKEDSKRQARDAVTAAIGTTTAPPAEVPAARSSGASMGWFMAAFISGVLIGVIALLGFAWFTV
jgi:hypothetical protein